MGNRLRVVLAALVVVLALTTAIGCPSAAADAKATTAFVNVTVIPMDRDEAYIDALWVDLHRFDGLVEAYAAQLRDDDSIPGIDALEHSAA